MKKLVFSIISCLILVGCGEIQREGSPKRETPSLPGDADECGIWINSIDTSRSAVIGNDKKSKGGLYVWDIDGKEIFNVSLNKPVGVDVRYGMMLKNELVDIVVCGLRSTNQIKVFRIDPKTRNLIDITTKNGISSGFSKRTYGISLYKRQYDGKIFVFVSSKKTDDIHQLELTEDSEGKVKGSLIRYFGKKDQKSFVEGMCVDDELGFFYCSDERSAILKYEADPDKKNNMLLLKFATNDGIKGDREGLALYKKQNNEGYLVLSSQGNSSFKIYQRSRNNNFVKTVYPKGVSKTDGIAINSTPILPLFPNGLVVCHNDKNSNFVFYDWKDFARLKKDPRKLVSLVEDY